MFEFGFASENITPPRGVSLLRLFQPASKRWRAGSAPTQSSPLPQRDLRRGDHFGRTLHSRQENSGRLRGGTEKGRFRFCRPSLDLHDAYPHRPLYGMLFRKPYGSEFYAGSDGKNDFRRKTVICRSGSGRTPFHGNGMFRLRVQPPLPDEVRRCSDESRKMQSGHRRTRRQNGSADSDPRGEARRKIHRIDRQYQQPHRYRWRESGFRRLAGGAWNAKSAKIWRNTTFPF